MTFIAGFNCFDGIVLCADSEESDGQNKKNVNKVFQINVGGEWGVAIAGAGRGSVIDSYWHKLKDVLGNDNYDRARIELTIERSLKAMLSTHSRNDQYFRIGVGVFGVPHLESKLYLSDRHCLAPIDECFTLGTADNSLAHCVMHTIFDKLMSVDEGVRLGVFLAALLGNHSDGVGGLTSIVSYKKGNSTWTRHDPAEIAKIESRLPINEFYWSIWNFWESRNMDVRKISLWEHLGKRKSFKPPAEE